MNLEELRAQRKDLKNKIVEASKEHLKEVSASLFDKYPKMNSFSWTQYTPWFNDGDTCEFGVNSDCDINGQYSYDNEDKDLEPAFDEVSKLVASFDEADLKEMFDDHVRVTVSRDGTIEVDGYSHD